MRTLALPERSCYYGCMSLTTLRTPPPASGPAFTASVSNPAHCRFTMTRTCLDLASMTRRTVSPISQPKQRIPVKWDEMRQLTFSHRRPRFGAQPCPGGRIRPLLAARGGRNSAHQLRNGRSRPLGADTQRPGDGQTPVTKLSHFFYFPAQSVYGRLSIRPNLGISTDASQLCGVTECYGKLQISLRLPFASPSSITHMHRPCLGRSSLHHASKAQTKLMIDAVAPLAYLGYSLHMTLASTRGLGVSLARL